MICQECNQRPATFHFTKVINGEKTEVHICEHCAQEKSEMFMFPGTSGFSIDNLLAGLLQFEPLTGSQQHAFQKNEVLQCENCKMTFQQFAKVGRFGCSQCYPTFEKQLTPILKRLHSGNTHHTGKFQNESEAHSIFGKRLNTLSKRCRSIYLPRNLKKLQMFVTT